MHRIGSISDSQCSKETEEPVCVVCFRIASEAPRNMSQQNRDRSQDVISIIVKCITLSSIRILLVVCKSKFRSVSVLNVKCNRCHHLSIAPNVLVKLCCMVKGVKGHSLRFNGRDVKSPRRTSGNCKERNNIER